MPSAHSVLSGANAKDCSRHAEEAEKPYNEFLLKFLRAGNHDIDFATKILTSYVELRRHHPKYYEHSTYPDVMQHVYRQKIHTILPHRDKFRRRVYLWRPGKWNPDEISFTDSYCAGYMLCEMIAAEPMTQVAGCTVVTDCSDFGLKQLKSLSMENIRTSAKFMLVYISA